MSANGSAWLVAASAHPQKYSQPVRSSRNRDYQWRADGGTEHREKATFKVTPTTRRQEQTSSENKTKKKEANLNLKAGLTRSLLEAYTPTQRDSELEAITTQQAAQRQPAIPPRGRFLTTHVARKGLRLLNPPTRSPQLIPASAHPPLRVQPPAGTSGAYREPEYTPRSRYQRQGRQDTRLRIVDKQHRPRPAGHATSGDQRLGGCTSSREENVKRGRWGEEGRDDEEIDEGASQFIVREVADVREKQFIHFLTDGNIASIPSAGPNFAKFAKDEAQASAVYDSNLVAARKLQDLYVTTLIGNFYALFLRLLN
ncbi:hypothetical protein B0H11DRAFT_1932312 [Mycena galericulata]|nr:hypothetical protein B0H11DRAFT_1932312 [Mycena galericulata]